MAAPVFGEFEPAVGAGRRGRAYRRRTARRPARPAGGAGRGMVLAVLAGGVLLAPPAVAAAPAPGAGGARHALRAEPADTPQGEPGRLFGERDGGTGAPEREPRGITREEIVERAARWVAGRVPYDMNAYWSDGYRQDCSGFVSMAWDLGTNEWTGSLARFAERITKNDLEPGDILLFHNARNPVRGSHVTIFGGWLDDSRNRYLAYELTPPNARKRDTPYAYWSNSSHYVPYRYKQVTAQPEATAGAGSGADAGPGTDAGPGADGRVWGVPGGPPPYDSTDTAGARGAGSGTGGRQ